MSPAFPAQASMLYGLVVRFPNGKHRTTGLAWTRVQQAGLIQRYFRALCSLRY